MGKLQELMEKARAVYSDEAAPGGKWEQFEVEARNAMSEHYPELWRDLGVGEVAFHDHCNDQIFFTTRWEGLYVRWDGETLELFDARRFQFKAFCVWSSVSNEEREDDDVGLFLLEAHWLRGGK